MKWFLAVPIGSFRDPDWPGLWVIFFVTTKTLVGFEGALGIIGYGPAVAVEIGGNGGWPTPVPPWVDEGLGGSLSDGSGPGSLPSDIVSEGLSL